MLSRRDVFGLAGSLTSVNWLHAQDAQQPVFWVKLSVTVTDSHNRYINGLKPSDFRVFEDGILQKIFTFSEGAKPPMVVNADGSTRPFGVDAKAAEGSKPGLNLIPEDEDLDNAYT